jgi:UDP-2-acetamido-3-amino-2,3-dideoxy-glucuronate N-acetyltransferase
MGKNQIIHNCLLGENSKVYDFVNLYGCEIGDECMVGTFVEIQKGVKIGNNVKIESHTFICEGVTIEDNVFVGHHVVFVNDKYPRSNNPNWELLPTTVRKGSSIGSNATILGGITIGENAIIGAGSVVTKDVIKNAIVAGNPAKVIRKI